MSAILELILKLEIVFIFVIIAVIIDCVFIWVSEKFNFSKVKFYILAIGIHSLAAGLVYFF